MAEFPKLRTGAVMQYPAGRSAEYSTRVLRFLDGSEQRFRFYPGAMRKWIIRLDHLEDPEIKALADFFRARQGSLDQFQFTDPTDDTQYENCSLEDDGFEIDASAEGRSGTVLVIRQNRS
ncbi:MAG: DUF2460 domain-containing protein [Bryobacteraceae bacterium]|nr:DUF2460 domain-containing protein [Bryobacterales bacterium]MEB2360441.1 DUF2460 domain-containing protein [Bryobacterales bacterium]NUN01197.1 DUF2460 domain-containing protein [Bryobacteraceae bacterium]